MGYWLQRWALWVILGLKLVHAQRNLRTHSSYLVTFDGVVSAEATEQSYRLFQQQMAHANIPFTLESKYTTGITGISIEVEKRYYRAIDDLPIVDLIQPNQVLELQSSANLNAVTDSGNDLPPMPFLAHDYTGLNDLLKAKNVTGKGVRVGIIDTGIDHRHRAFGSCYKTPGCRVAYGYDFVGDDFDGVTEPQPDDDPLDTCNAHGTAVAGIIAGNDGEFRGVAPEATLGIYRVMSCKNVLYDRYIMDALTKAVEDDMEVINLSVGNSQAFFWSVLSQFANNIGKQKKVVMAAVGNTGNQYMFTMYSPAVAVNTFAVGSYELPYYYALPLTCHLSSGNFTIPRSATQNGAPELRLPAIDLILGTDSNNQTTGCAPFAQDLTGKVVLLVRGACEVQTKAANAEDAGAVAAIVYDITNDPLGPYVFEGSGHIPTVMIGRMHGLVLQDQLKAGEVWVSSEPLPTVFKHDAPFTVSPYSSWGPGVYMENKPDMLAPGSNLYVPVPKEFGSYGIVSGTSFSTAYMSGCAAIIADEKTYISYKWAKRDLSFNARVATSLDRTTAPTAQQGYGMLNLTRLFETYHNAISKHFGYLFGTQLVPAGAPGPTNNLTLVNWTGKPRTIRLKHIPSVSISAFDAQGNLLLKPRTSNVAANLGFDTLTIEQTSKEQFLNVTFDVRHFDPKDKWVYSGFVEVRDLDGLLLDRSSYVGLAASMHDLPMLPPPNSPDAPCLTRGKDQTCLALSGNHAYTMTGDDFPSVRYRLQFGVRAIYFTIITTVNGEAKEYLINEGDPRGAVRNDFSVRPYYTALWDGSVYKPYSDPTLMAMPAGEYHFRFRLCRPGYICNRAAPDSRFRIWESNPFTITR
ncbi:hypothetical protein H4R34_000480 [Dimargaris verticillata]|uniref:Peptidase S8/S53 domain-containing protein n=1 Tax=Dimargaris verticillata TaxID=2761393 RepID=A0A9W8EFW1_9FUNG|nr:hypothetical protein H4R34_000480 [Dimargaris verticillata]